MMDEYKDKRYIKEIIKEYNILLESWGSSESWDLNQFKTLENMIFETTKIDVNANTLKRFFQQKTGNPQLATKDALCRFLGYSGYTDFVMKKTKKEETTNIQTEDVVEETKEHTNDTDKKADSSQLEKAPNKVTKDPEEVSNRIYKKNKWYVNFAIILLLIIGGYMLYTYKLKDMYVEYLLSKIEFTTSQVKGICPLTVTFSYHIPASLFEDITVMYEEANGDISERKLNENIDKINATYIYEGEAFCHLKYKDRIIKTIPVECRKTGWSVFVREERKKIFRVFPMEQAYNDSGYVSLPIENVPQEAHTNHMFVSYVFYKEKLIDGDNFIYEARVRNSKQENAVPCSAQIFGHGSMDVITTNPPYMIGGHGFANPESAKAIARHEVLCTLDDIIRESARTLKAGGRFYMVHRPFRLAEILTAMCEAKLEPKRMRLVYPYVDKEPNMVLIEGIRGAKSRMTVEPPLIVYEKDGSYTQEILEHYGMTGTGKE